MWSLLFAGLCPAQIQTSLQERREEIRSSRHEFHLHLGGTLDGANTLDPTFTGAPRQAFEPMRSVRLENTGSEEIRNPWIIVNGRRNWRTAQDIVKEALTPSGAPEPLPEAVKARALYEFVRRNRFHATPGDFEVRDPVKIFNIYGYALCGDNASVLADLWRLAGLKVRRGFPNGHCTSEVWYEGSWHLLDADLAALYLERDNRTLSSGPRLARDPDLVRQAAQNELDATIYEEDSPVRGEFSSHLGHVMQVRLRPGEALEWRWDHRHKYHQAISPFYALQDTRLREHWGEAALSRLANGKWIFAPPLRLPSCREGVQGVNVRWNRSRSVPAVVPLEKGKPASLVWRVDAPYVILGGQLQARLQSRGGGTWKILLSQDGASWTELKKSASPGGTDLLLSLDEFFPSVGVARYGYFLKIELETRNQSDEAGLDLLRLENDLQMAPLSLPALELGDNAIEYTDETTRPHSARVTFEWREAAGILPPEPPAAPLFPADGAEAEGTSLSFRWQAAACPSGGPVVNYHFQLCPEPQCRWPLSSRFDLLVSDAEGEAQASHSLPSAGLLNPGERYWWRVRARSQAGVWSRWSQAWSFVPQGPGVPLSLRISPDGLGRYSLEWESNPRGRKPAEYLVYASNEKGFTPTDSPVERFVGNQKQRGWFAGREKVVFPPSFLTKTVVPRLDLVPEAAFYRVVAVDEKGNRSGSSDYVSGPRPYIYSQPPREARVGVLYRFEAKTVVSLGSLTHRDFPPTEFNQMAFWMADHPRFFLVDELSRCGIPAPAWLRLDPETGILSGIPGREDIGEYHINLKVEIDKAGSEIISFPLVVRE